MADARGDVSMKQDTMRALILVIVAGALFVGSPAWAGDSWWIDPARYHMSVHGQNACRDCHGETAEKALHPDPAMVTKDLADFFRVDQCLDCHDNILDDLAQGVHGERRVEDPAEYRTCLGCHDPHYQFRPSQDRQKDLDAAGSRQGRCGACHEPRSSLPSPLQEDEACAACHFVAVPPAPGDAGRVRGFCFHCHGRSGSPAQKITGRRMPLIIEASYLATPHGEMGCTVCHAGAAAFNHDEQRPVPCRECHLPHDAKVARDAHMAVSCESCHLKGVRPVRDPESGRVLWKRAAQPGDILILHDLVRFDGENGCRRCHVSGNTLGAPSRILPAKGILCMPCHTATFSMGDMTTILSLLLFGVGMVGATACWLSGSVGQEREKNAFFKTGAVLGKGVKQVFSRKFFWMVRTLFLDVLLQRRLFKQSRARWVIHGLIFFPIVLRFLWGLVALLGSLWRPEWPWVWHLVDRNAPVTALLFDLTGVMIIAGVAAALGRGVVARAKRPPGLPGQDRLALGLIAGIGVAGFILEGMKMAMTGHPADSKFAFLGYGISRLFSDPRGLEDLYGTMWYVHAVLTGAFVAYIPFSRLLHMIMGPVVLVMNAMRDLEHRPGRRTRP